MRNKNVIKMCRLAVFLAAGIILSYFESFIPSPVPLPGVRLGLANTIGLIILYFYSPKEFVGVNFLRVIIVGLLRGSLVSFSISISGWLVSTIIVLIFYFFKKGSIYGLSVASAISHCVGQIIMVMILYNLPQMVYYLPILLFTSIISGIVIAIISAIVLKRLDKFVK